MASDANWQSQPLSVVEVMLEKRLETQRSQNITLSARISEHERRAAQAARQAEADSARQRELERQATAAAEQSGRLGRELESVRRDLEVVQRKADQMGAKMVG